ncbi:MAG TPA: division/cell wall cluster transcriptional repressor MraZ [Bacteroidetes bacterium]|nr:division/cell wall cluster transcriptional repressor MraZ [Bacteroidota bacterium]
MAGFKGRAENSIDAKGRVAVPASMRRYLRPEARETFVVTQGMDQCIVLYPYDVWEDEIEPRINALDPFNREEALLSRRVLMWTDEVTLDSQGRVTLPRDLMELVGLEPGEKARMLGVTNRIEVWAPSAYAAYLNGSAHSVAELAEKHLSRRAATPAADPSDAPAALTADAS